MSEMKESVKPTERRHAALRRAVRFVWPYRKMVAASVVCALLMGLITTIGLSAILPILKVLIEGQTVAEWVDEQALESRLGHEIRTGETLTQPGSSSTTTTEITPAVIRQMAVNEDVPGLKPTPGPWRAVRWLASFVPTRPIYAIAAIFGFISLMAVCGSVFRFFHEHLSDRVAIFAVNDLRRRMYDHVLRLPLAYFGKFGTSDATSRLVSDAAQLQDGIRVLLGQMIQAPISAAMSLGLALFINWKLTLVVILFLPAMFVVMRKLGTKVRRAMRAALQKSASMLGQIESTLQGVRVVKASRAERFERRRYGGIMSELVKEQLKMSRYEAITTPAMETMALVAVGAILLIASWMMFEKHWLEPTSFMMIMIALGSIAEPMRRLSKLNNVTQRANAAAVRMFEIMDTEVEARRNAVAATRNEKRVSLPSLQRDILFDNVSFSYPGGANVAVDHVTLRVPKGQSVAVVGRNGSGKTTLLALLPRFYDPTGGAVLIDGVDLRQATLRSLRRQISLVTQESVVFPGTIAQNIAYGLPLARRDEIENAARRAFSHDFILAKPQGYDTLLDGLGSQLSGGQKQRLCIARAILRNAPILILDEATSQVDAESEHLIQQAIEGLMHEATTFVIAHRFSTILSADVIVVMDQGRIVGQGKHEALLKTCEVYQQLYERQMIGAAG